MQRRTFKNTFISHVTNKELSVDMIIQCLFRQVVRYNDLPADVQDAVDEEMTRRTAKSTNS